MFYAPDSRVQEAPNVALSSCQLELLPTSCGPDGCAQGTLFLTATSDFTRDGNRASLVTPQPTRGSPRPWRSYRPDPVKVSSSLDRMLLHLFLSSLSLRQYSLCFCQGLVLLGISFLHCINIISCMLYILEM